MIWTAGTGEDKVALLGRHGAETAPYPLYWTGSGVEARLGCRSLAAELELPQGQADHAVWMLVTVDGAPAARFAVEGGRRWYPLLDGMDPAVPHVVDLLRETQPIGDGVSTGLKLHALRSDGTLLPLPRRDMTIEFVGDSLTTGEGVVGPQSAMEWKTVWMSSYNYTHMVCEALNARRRIISQSGWGVYSSWDRDKACVLPAIYDQVCQVGDADPAPYDFTRDPADVVVINLGTNDSGALNRVEDAAEKRRWRREVEQAAVRFLRQVRERNPRALILWVYGMCGHPDAPIFRRAAEAVGDPRVGYLTLPPCRRADLGSREHPGVRNHRAAANAIADWIGSHLEK